MVEASGADPREVTALLRRLRDGDGEAADELLPLVHTELHRLARRAMAGRRPDHTLQPTALLNEAWIRIAGDSSEVRGREHFLALAATVMRSVLVDHERRRRAQKRGGGAERVELDGLLLECQTRSLDLLALDEALDELARADPHLTEIVELRFFGGLDHGSIADLLGSSLRTVERDWAAARDWLRQRLAAV